jgi:uncharacterized protein (TIGR02266 family)
VRYSTLDQLVCGYAKDLSKGGMFVATSRFLPVNAVVRVHIELPDGGGVVPVIARVAFVRDEGEAATARLPSGMGLEFLDLAEDSLNAIARFVSERTLEVADRTPPAPRSRPLEILVVDDVPEMREGLAEPFRARNDRVEVAPNGMDALAMCLRRPPDVLLTDIAMPHMDGWQLLRILRARPSLAALPVVFVTSHLAETERLRGFQLGVDDYVTKPFSPAEMVARVDRLVARCDHGGAVGKKTLRGNLSQVALPMVLSFLELERQTGVLLIVRPPRSARIWVAEGRPLRVEVEGATRVTTAQRLFSYVLSWEGGQFEFARQDVMGEDELQTSMTALLLEQARLTDEAARRSS